jgi:hypothetical protein
MLGKLRQRRWSLDHGPCNKTRLDEDMILLVMPHNRPRHTHGDRRSIYHCTITATKELTLIEHRVFSSFQSSLRSEVPELSRPMW